MILLQLLREILLNPDYTSYIVALQVPTVLCLIFQCIQAYRLELKEFKLISTAWVFNLAYLLTTILVNWAVRESWIKLIIITSVDLVSMYLFFEATIPVFAVSLPPWLRRFTRRRYAIPIFLMAGVIRCIPGSLYIVHYIHLRYVPDAFVNFAALFSLAMYFLTMTGPRRRRWGLFAFALLYACVQFIGIMQKDQFQPQTILYFDNIGFTLGLISKVGMLVILSLSTATAIRETAQEEKREILKKITFAADILKIKKQHYTPISIIEEENEILQSVLTECLTLLNEQLGYYARYDEDSRTLTVMFTSDKYRDFQGYSFTETEGLVGTAAQTRHPRLVNTNIENSEYVNSDQLKYGRHDPAIDRGVRSALAIPVILYDHLLLGVYLIESKTEGHFTPLDEQILIALVSQAQTAIANIRLVKENELAKDTLDSLQTISEDIMAQGNSLELTNILDLILDKALKMAKCEFGNISLINDNHQLILSVSTKKDNIGKTVDIHDSISGKVYQEKAVDYTPDIRLASEEKRLLYKNWSGENMVSWLAAPLMVQGKVIGILNMESPRPDAFRNALRDVERHAGQAAMAIHIFKLLEDVKRTRLHLEALTEIEKDMLNAHRSLPEILNMILQGAMVLKKKYAEILLFNREQQLVIVRSTEPANESRVLTLNSISGLTIEKEMPVYLPFIDRDEELGEVVEEDVYVPQSNDEKFKYRRLGRKDPKSELCLPLYARRKVIGVFNLESTEYKDFPKDERLILKNLALAASIAINNAQLLDEIMIKNQELKNSINKDRLDLSRLLASIIYHRIGNAIGIIRFSIDSLVNGEYGSFHPDVERELSTIQERAEVIVVARRELREKVADIIQSSIPVPIDFREWQTRIRQNKELARYPDILIDIAGVETLPPVAADISLFSEITFELIMNAIKAMDGKGTVTIRGACNESQVTLTFSDHGCGIAASAIKKIFDPDYSFWPNDQGGDGFGLADVKAILSRYGGTIEVDSEPGKGSTFRVRIPIINDITKSILI